MQKPALHQLLYRISLEHVIHYIPSDNSTVIYLHHGRLMPGNVNLQPDKYKFLKDTAQERTEAMVDYVMESGECRSRYLLRYFGQEESSDCGTCDVCRGAEHTSSQLGRIRKFMEDRPEAGLEEFKAFVDDPANGLGPQAYEEYRRIIDEKTLS